MKFDRRFRRGEWEGYTGFDNRWRAVQWHATCLWFFCYVHMELDFVSREILFLEILDSFATPAKCLSRFGRW